LLSYSSVTVNTPFNYTILSLSASFVTLKVT